MRAAGSSRRWAAGAWLAAAGGALAALALLQRLPLPAGPEHSICFLRHYTGVPCAGCGLTRAFAALGRGDFAAAVALHPLAPLFLLEAIVGWLVWGWLLLRRGGFPSWAPVNRVLTADAVLLLVVWGVRLATGTLPW